MYLTSVTSQSLSPTPYGFSQHSVIYIGNVAYRCHITKLVSNTIWFQPAFSYIYCQCTLQVSHHKACLQHHIVSASIQLYILAMYLTSVTSQSLSPTPYGFSQHSVIYIANVPYKCHITKLVSNTIWFQPAFSYIYWQCTLQVSHHKACLQRYMVSGSIQLYILAM